MAKVSDLKFDIKGVDYKVPVNCNYSGEFNANLPEEVAKALRVQKKLTAKTLHQLTSDKFRGLQVGQIVSHEDYSSEKFKVTHIDKETGIVTTSGGKNGVWINHIDLIIRKSTKWKEN